MINLFYKKYQSIFKKLWELYKTITKIVPNIFFQNLKF